MYLHHIKRLKETTDIDIANALLASGWNLIEIFPRCGKVVYLLGSIEL